MPVDTRIEGNRAIPSTPDAADLPADTVARAGLTGRWQQLTTSSAPGIGYAHKTTDGGDVLVAGHGYGPGIQVDFDGVPAARITVLSNGVLNAEPPSGTDPVRVTVTTHAGSATAVLS